MDAYVPLTIAARDDLFDLIDRYIALLAKRRDKRFTEEQQARMWPTLPSQGSELIAEAMEKLTVQTFPRYTAACLHRLGKPIISLLDGFLSRSDINVVHACRWCMLMNREQVESHDYAQTDWLTGRQDSFMVFHQNAGKDLNWLDWSAALETLGYPRDRLGRWYLLDLDGHYKHFLHDLPSDKIWPYFAKHRDLIEAALGRDVTGQYQVWDHSAKRAHLLLAMSPTGATDLQPETWHNALEGQPEERGAAQQQLAARPSFVIDIQRYLAEGTTAQKRGAVDWLAQIGTPDLIPNLLDRYRAETEPNVRHRILVALDKLGHSMDALLDRDGLCAHAEREVTGGLPGDMAWLRNELPTLVWSDSGRVVESVVIWSFIIEAARLDDLDPSPLVRRYLALMEESGRNRLGQWLFDAWLMTELGPFERNEVNYSLVDSNDYRSPTEAWQGVFALVAATRADVTESVGRYRTNRYMLRGHVMVRMLEMLARTDNPAVVSYLQSYDRFTKGHKWLKEIAQKILQSIANRKDRI
jgi:hypothetical protein